MKFLQRPSPPPKPAMDDCISSVSDQRARQALEVLAGQPRLELGHFPTPVREMVRLREHLACAPRLWIKHDDYSGPAFGGNKVRKLEYVLAKGLGDKATDVITAGGVTSNHARITAGLCARLGLKCHLVLNAPPGQPVPVQGRPASLLLDEMFGAKIHSAGSPEERLPRMMQLAARLGEDGAKVLLIPLGASTPLGALGFVRAARELSEQASTLGLRLGAVVHATSSAGTQAGLVAGVNLFGPEDASVIGISADAPATEIKATVQDILAGVSRLLGLDGSFPSRLIEVDDRFTGAGYAVPSDEGREATALLARREGVILDPVYTAKAMAGFLDLARSGRFGEDDNILFWHTGGQLALFQELIV